MSSGKSMSAYPADDGAAPFDDGTGTAVAATVVVLGVEAAIVTYGSHARAGGRGQPVTQSDRLELQRC